MFPAEWIYKGNYEFTMPQLREVLGVPRVNGAKFTNQLRGRSNIRVVQGRLHGVIMKDEIIRVPIDKAEEVWLDLNCNPLDLSQKMQCSNPREPSQLDRIEAKLDALLAHIHK